VDVSHDGRRIAAVGESGEANVWDVLRAVPTRATLPVGDALVVQFSPDGRWLGVGTRTEVRFWSFSGERFSGGRIAAGAESLIFSPDARLVAVPSASGEGTDIWRALDAGFEEFSLETSIYGGYQSLFLRDNVLLEAKEGELMVRHLNEGKALGRACELVGRDLTPAERTRYLGQSDLGDVC
jgi:WD40 repeat protein